ncbi:MAG: 50S ribosomal protein L11 methyltransferase, partial [Betaproteobacteria bacterium]|nr:50S ribosomal protein L11 methyltransferase [Betaproteobacteria bacterium]
VMASFIAAEESIAAPADLVVANIFANPLIVLAPLLAGITKPGGRVALSGILAGQAEDVRAAYRGWFIMDEAEQEDGWVLLSGQRRTR